MFACQEAQLFAIYPQHVTLCLMKVRLGKRQQDKIADISIGLGQLFFGSTVIPFIISSLDRPPTLVLLFGIALASGLWLLAIKLVK